MPRALLPGLFTFAVAVYLPAVSAPSTKSFAFQLARISSPRQAQELWRATATTAPPSARPAHFRVRLDAVRHTDLRTGAAFRGAFLAGDSVNTGMSWYALLQVFPPSGSGGLNPTPADSVPFSGIVRPSAAGDSKWIAEIQLVNGAHVVLVVDASAGRGELRPVSAEYSLRVLSAFMGLGLKR